MNKPPPIPIDLTDAFAHQAPAPRQETLVEATLLYAKTVLRIVDRKLSFLLARAVYRYGERVARRVPPPD